MGVELREKLTLLNRSCYCMTSQNLWIFKCVLLWIMTFQDRVLVSCNTFPNLGLFFWMETIKGLVFYRICMIIAGLSAHFQSFPFRGHMTASEIGSCGNEGGGLKTGNSESLRVPQWAWPLSLWSPCQEQSWVLLRVLCVYNIIWYTTFYN